MRCRVLFALTSGLPRHCAAVLLFGLRAHTEVPSVPANVATVKKNTASSAFALTVRNHCELSTFKPEAE